VFKKTLNLLFMKKTRILHLLAILALTAGMVSCEYEWVEPEVVVLPQKVSFASDILPVFNKSCNMSGCHAQGAVAPDLSAANAFTDLMNRGLINTEQPAQSPLYLSVFSGSMKKFSTSADNALILKWIEQGAQNN
jgi:hypothetical protein